MIYHYNIYFITDKLMQFVDVFRSHMPITFINLLVRD